MKTPKSRKKYCPYCRKYSVHKVSSAKRKTKGSVHTLSRGSKIRAKLRGVLGSGNMGKYSKPPGGGKMYGKKQSKKTDFRFKCSSCNKIHTQRVGLRAKKIEFV